MTAILNKAFGQSPQYLVLNNSTLRPKSNVLGRMSGSANTRPIICKKKKKWKILLIVNPDIPEFTITDGKKGLMASFNAA